MRLPRVRMTILALMVSVVVAGLFLAAFVALRDRRSRAMEIRAATAGYSQARLTREVAEMALSSYVSGIFPADQRTIDGDIALAEAVLARAQDRVAWLDRVLSKGPRLDSTVASYRLAVDKARFDVEQARTRREVLIHYTRVRTTRELQAEVAKSRADELSRKATLDLLKARPTWPS